MTKLLLKSISLLVFLSLIFTVGCKKEEKNQAPTCKITSPQNNAQFSTDEDIYVTMVAEDVDGTVANVQLYIQQIGVSAKIESHYNATIKAGELKPGTYTLTAVAEDNKGAKGEASITIVVNKPTLAVGMPYQGGIIAYLDDTGEHGLIAAPEDQNTGIQWYNGNYLATGATGTAKGTGQSNTTKIVQTQGDGEYAAKLCDDLVLNGYDDWFLPSEKELDLLYQNRELIGGFSDHTYYWSSTEFGSTEAWALAFIEAQRRGDQKYKIFRVRAVRVF